MLDIARFLENPGWAVIGVFADPASDSPSFSYTVGLTAKGLPELITLGLPTDVAHSILNDAARRLIAGERFESGQRISELANMPMAVAHVDPADARHTAYAAFKEFPEGPRFLQLVWPDRKGAFPGEPECEDRFAQIQDIAALAEQNRSKP